MAALASTSAACRVGLSLKASRPAARLTARAPCAPRRSLVCARYEGVMDSLEEGETNTAESSPLLRTSPDDIIITEIMTSPAQSLQVGDDIKLAMERLVAVNCSGMPVIDDVGEVVGVISGYDLLALACTPGKLDNSDGYFPKVDKCIREYGGDTVAMWKAFKDLRNDLQKENGRTVGEVMHEAYTIPDTATLAMAADLIVQRRLHRLCVVDRDDKLIGVVSRGDIMRATITNFRTFMKDEDERASSSSDEDDL